MEAKALQLPLLTLTFLYLKRDREGVGVAKSNPTKGFALTEVAPHSTGRPTGATSALKREGKRIQASGNTLGAFLLSFVYGV